MKPFRGPRLPTLLDVPADMPRTPMLARVAWMFAIWLASVLALAVVAGVLKLALAR